MLRKALFAVVLMLLPAAASAQEHKHGETAKNPHHAHTGAAKAHEHINVAQFAIEKRAELNLTEEQIGKLEDLSAKIAQHHAQEAKAPAKTNEADHAKIHEELTSILTEAQAAKVKQLMKDDMEKCASGEDKQCKVEAKPKVKIQ